jgi:hypothetical protein
MLIYTYQKSKKKNKTKKEMEEYQAWLDSITNQKTNYSIKNMREVVFNPNWISTWTVPAGRETVRHPSKVTLGGSGTKPVRGNVYTGSAMLGIGTLHKSNAVPIFSNEEACDQAKMRR